jgi:hypothetical protein
MIKFVKNIENFWKEDLANHKFARQVEFVAENFNHLDRTYYNSGFLLQSFNEEIPNIQDFQLALDVKNTAISWLCILPNVILPTHRDTFYTLRQEHAVGIEQCFRYLIFLEDRVFGHYVGFENLNITNWKAGDVWMFDCEENHYGVNASNVPFVTCQVSSYV